MHKSFLIQLSSPPTDQLGSTQLVRNYVTSPPRISLVYRFPFWCLFASSSSSLFSSGCCLLLRAPTHLAQASEAKQTQALWIEGHNKNDLWPQLCKQHKFDGWLYDFRKNRSPWKKSCNRNFTSLCRFAAPEPFDRSTSRLLSFRKSPVIESITRCEWLFRLFNREKNGFAQSPCWRRQALLEGSQRGHLNHFQVFTEKNRKNFLTKSQNKC